ncbi:MAG: UvrD-helicase domain-containing protein, partial [bacterium]
MQPRARAVGERRRPVASFWSAARACARFASPAHPCPSPERPLAVATLNPAQQQAVEHERGPALVIAGAGSG